MLTNPFHVGLVVADVEKSMELISSGSDTTWHSIQSLDLNLLVGGEVVSTRVSFTYSVEGPVQVELAQGPSGSFWDVELYGGLNHLGYWADNLLGDIKELQDSGCQLVYGGASSDGSIEGFAFMKSPSGVLLELIDVKMRPMFDRWFAGGSFA